MQKYYIYSKDGKDLKTASHM